MEAPTNPSILFRRAPQTTTFPGPPARPTATEPSEGGLRVAWRPSSNHGASVVSGYVVEMFSPELSEVGSRLYFHSEPWRTIFCLTIFRHIYRSMLNPFPDEQLNLVDIVPEQVAILVSFYYFV